MAETRKDTVISPDGKIPFLMSSTGKCLGLMEMTDLCLKVSSILLLELTAVLCRGEDGREN